MYIHYIYMDYSVLVLSYSSWRTRSFKPPRSLSVTLNSFSCNISLIWYKGNISPFVSQCVYQEFINISDRNAILYINTEKERFVLLFYFKSCVEHCFQQIVSNVIINVTDRQPWWIVSQTNNHICIETPFYEANVMCDIITR